MVFPMSLCPGMLVKKYVGFVDVHMIRILKIFRVEDQVPQMIEKLIDELLEIAKAKVEALGGNCLLGLKVDVNTLE